MAEPGRQIGPYRLIARIGAGAMGEVWQARDRRLDRLVAVKLLPTAVADDPEKRARMLREAKASAAVPHPNVVTLYDIVSEGGDDVLVMELVKGQTLSDRVKKSGALALAEAMPVLISLADALAAAHGRGILHRDIKTANLMLDERGQIKVLDFGLAKLLDSADEIGAATTHTQIPAAAADESIGLDETVGHSQSQGSVTEQQGSQGSYLETVAGSLIGTPLYMAPEQLQGAAPDERSEVYSFGVVAYELLSGKPPYGAGNLSELIEEVKEGGIDVSSLPPVLRDLVAGCLETDPDERYQRMEEVRDALELAHRELSAPRRRRLWAWSSAAALITAIATAAIVYVATRAPEEPPKRPGYEHVERALKDYNVFFTKRAVSSLRSALKVDPQNPRAYAYLFLFGGVADRERDRFVDRAEQVLKELPATSPRERALLGSAIKLVTEGPRAAAVALTGEQELTRDDPELAFWAAEFAFRAGDYDSARSLYARLLEGGETGFEGRIYDHYSAVLLYFGDAAEARRIGELYVKKHAGEADAIGVYATTLSAAGDHDRALAQAREALAIHEGEDTLAGLGKIHAYRGEFELAIDYYRQSRSQAPPGRRPLRRAALALLHLLGGEVERAQREVEPCLPGGEDSETRERGSCLWMAALLYPERAEEVAGVLDALAAESTPLRPAYGSPEALARLVRARAEFFGGGCLTPPPTQPPPPPERAAAIERLLTESNDFYAAYHLPFFAVYATCERAAVMAAGAPGREVADWLLEQAAGQPQSQLLLLRAAELMTTAGVPGGGEQADAFLSSWASLDEKSALRIRAEAVRASRTR